MRPVAFPTRAIALVALVSTLASRAARAEARQVDVTQTAIGAFHANNRDALIENDDYSEWIDRLGVRLAWARFAATVRLDSAVYFAPPSPEYLASVAVAQPDNCLGQTPQSCYGLRLLEYQRALLNRYQNTVYPSKVSATYTAPALELALGDFYAQFGRGLTLSVRKVDEFAYDTTIRGAKVDWNWRGTSGRLGATLLGGYANPVRVDEISGRRLASPRSWIFPGMPGFDPNATYGPAATETFRPDGIVGARVEGGGDRFLLGAYASLIARGGLSEIGRRDEVNVVAFRDSHPARQVKYLQTASASLSLPRIREAGAGYLEVAAQRFDPAASPFGVATPPDQIVNGHAVIGSLSLDTDRWLALLEFRHTRRFSALMANVDTGRAGEFFGLQYSAPPTTEPITTDTELGFFATCTTGGRARVDRRLTENVIMYGSLGFYLTWTERLPDRCAPGGGGLADADRNDVWDPLGGVIVTYNQGRSRANIWGGARFDQMPVSQVVSRSDGSMYLTREFYREGYLRYDALHAINGTWAAQIQGTHRARSEPQTDRPWNEGENYLAAHWASRVIAAVGFEYTTRGDRTLTYVNGSVLYRLPRRWFPKDSSLRVFAGQQRGALRCINGVCKVFPDFTGARAELVLRF